MTRLPEECREAIHHALIVAHEDTEALGQLVGILEVTLSAAHTNQRMIARKALAKKGGIE